MPDSPFPEVKKNYSLQPYNTLGVEARASRFISIESQEQLKGIINDHRYKKLLKLVMGGGSNILFVGDFDGLVLHIAIKGIEKIKEDEEYVWIKAGAGENWHQLVLHCVEKGWGGIENLSLIPGRVGAAPIQNIGAYGVELQEVFESLEAVEMENGISKTFAGDDCRFGYRDSIFKNEFKGEYIITQVVLRLSRHPQLNTSYGAIRSKLQEKGIGEPTIKDISDVVIEIRNTKLPNPNDIGNAGSFFKNPVISGSTFDRLQQDYPGIPGYPLDQDGIKVPAGWLIEQTGWKGKVVGHTGTYRQQALVIVNHGGATGKEILELANRIQASVNETFGIELVPEVNIIG